MTIYQSGDSVKLKPAILEDETLKSNHHLLERILKEERVGEVRERDLDKSTTEAFYYWVKFHYAAILLHEHHIVKA